MNTQSGPTFEDGTPYTCGYLYSQHRPAGGTSTPRKRRNIARPSCSLGSGPLMRLRQKLAPTMKAKAISKR